MSERTRIPIPDRRVVVRLTAAILMGLAHASARAMCGSPYIFNQSSDGWRAAPPANTYIVSPGRYQLDGAFWALGNAVGPYRATNGGWEFSNWHRIYQGRHYIAGTWGSDQRIYGCIRRGTSVIPGNMGVGIWDQSTDGLHGYFGIMCVQPNPVTWDFDFSDVGGDLKLVDIPAPTVVSGNQSGSTLELRARLAGVSEGTQTDGSCPSNLTTGYRLYYQARPPGAAAPSDRRSSAGWIAGPAAPLGHDVTVTIPCAGCGVYLAAAVLMDGIETGVVSEHVKASREEDDPQADPDSDGIPNAEDDCKLSFNSNQADFDGDGQGDDCDLDDGLIRIGFSSAGFIEWQTEQGFEAWDVYAGDMDVLRATGVYTQLPGSNPLAEQYCGMPWTFLPASTDPSIGKVKFWLVLGVQDGVKSSLGRASNGLERHGELPCP